MKKLFIIGILIIALLPFTACEELPAGDELMSRVYEAMAEVDSYKEDLDVTMRFYVEGGDYTADMPLAMDIIADSHIIYDVVNEEMEMTMEYDISSDDEDITMKMEMAIYLVGDMLYAMMDVPFAPGEWTKSPVPDGYWEEMDYLEIQMNLFEASGIEVLGKERKENVECYVVQMKPDISQLFELIMGQTTVPLGQLSASDFDMISEMFQNYSVKMWIDKEEYLIVYAEIQMYIEATPELMGMYDEEGMVSINATMDMRSYDYDLPVAITVPEEAEEAEESFMW